MRFDKFWLRVTPIIRDLLPIGHAGSQSIFGKAFCSQAYLVFFQISLSNPSRKKREKMIRLMCNT